MRILLSVLLLFCSVGRAATNWIFTLDQATIQAAVDAASNGDTLILTNGTGTLTSRVVWQDKSVNIIGSNGTNTSMRDCSTTINQNITDVTKSVINVDLKYGYFVFIKGIKFTCTKKANNGLVNISANDVGPGNRTDGYTNGVRCRISKCSFYYEPSDLSGSGSMRGIAISSGGVVDHCYFEWGTVATGSAQSIEVNYDGGNGTGVTNYEAPQIYGSTNCLVIEDCVINHINYYGDDGIEAYSTTKFVSRYNSFTNTGIGLHGADSDSRGCRQFEIYGNNFNGLNLASDQHFQVLLFRSGAGVIYSNTIYNTASHQYNTFTTMRCYRANSGYTGWYGSAFNHLPSGGLQGPCNGSRNIDGNFTGTGYPALDQVGRGSFPTSWTITTWPYATNDAEVLEPVYMWGNTNSGAYSTGSNLNGWGLDTGNDTANVANFIQEGRDVYDGTLKPGYTALVYPHPWVTAMDGTNGGGGSSSPPTATVPAITRRIRIAR